MSESTFLAAVGDVHGHLQLALCVLARWQVELGRDFDAVLLCGDVGTFTDESQLDGATRAHAKRNPCELEFLHQWARHPQPCWLQWIFTPRAEGGLGLTCPVIMVHGNHEGFTHLEQLVPNDWPIEPADPSDLPTVDAGRHIRLLPSGWRVRLPGGIVVAGVGGMQPGQRTGRRHPMAYIDPFAIEWLLETGQTDVLITHQGPSLLHEKRGSSLLDPFLREGFARVWFHGHSLLSGDVTRMGPGGKTTVVPLRGIAFYTPRQHTLRDEPYEVSLDGWALATLTEDKLDVAKIGPPFYREYRRYRWIEKDGLLICPDLAGWLGE